MLEGTLTRMIQSMSAFQPPKRRRRSVRASPSELLSLLNLSGTASGIGVPQDEQQSPATLLGRTEQTRLPMQEASVSVQSYPQASLVNAVGPETICKEGRRKSYLPPKPLPKNMLKSSSASKPSPPKPWPVGPARPCPLNPAPSWSPYRS